MPEPEKLSDLEIIRAYAKRGGRRMKALGRRQIVAFSLPEKVASELDRQADQQGFGRSQFLFNALVEKILIGRIWEKHHDHGTSDDTATSNRVAARRSSPAVRRRNREARKNSD